MRRSSIQSVILVAVSLSFIVSRTGGLLGQERNSDKSNGEWIPTESDDVLEFLIAKDHSLATAQIEVKKHFSAIYDPASENLKRVFQYRLQGISPPAVNHASGRAGTRENVEVVELLNLQRHEGFRRLSRENTIPAKPQLSFFPQSETYSLQDGIMTVTRKDGDFLNETIVRQLDPVRAFDDGQLEVEFSLGVGFGSRMIIQTVDREGDMAIVDARLSLRKGEFARATLEIDRDFIVRKAGMQSTDSGRKTETFITTSGLISDRNGAKYAAESQVRKITLPANQADSKRQPHSVTVFRTTDHRVTELSNASKD